MVKKIIEETKIPVKIWTNEVEEEALEQLKNVANLPIVAQHVAVMPDVHLGKGATVGSVIATRGAIIPAAVGVDIGCGMCAVALPLHSKRLLEKDKYLKRLRSQIEQKVPVGNSREGEHKKSTEQAQQSYRRMESPSTALETKLEQKALRQLGTLGGGNHFIEICEDETKRIWVMLHSGSRNVGNRLANKHIEKAKGSFKDYLQADGTPLPDPDLAYFVQQTKEFDQYLHDLFWAQNYAKVNRHLMMNNVLKVMIDFFNLGCSPQELMKNGMIDCHHNYTSLEEHFGEKLYITRKGAVSAYKGEMGIIPGSMGAKSFLVEGKGHSESFCSCSHGAGRKMGRRKAKRTFSLDDFLQQTKDVECQKSASLIDEIPAAYKDIDQVMKFQEDLVSVKHTLKQLICVKGV